MAFWTSQVSHASCLCRQTLEATAVRPALERKLTSFMFYEDIWEKPWSLILEDFGTWWNLNGKLFELCLGSSLNSVWVDMQTWIQSRSPSDLFSPWRLVKASKSCRYFLQTEVPQKRSFKSAVWYPGSIPWWHHSQGLMGVYRLPRSAQLIWLHRQALTSSLSSPSWSSGHWTALSQQPASKLDIRLSLGYQMTWKIFWGHWDISWKMEEPHFITSMFFWLQVIMGAILVIT